MRHSFIATILIFSFVQVPIASAQTSTPVATTPTATSLSVPAEKLIRYQMSYARAAEHVRDNPDSPLPAIMAAATKIFRDNHDATAQTVTNAILPIETEFAQ